MLKEKCVNSWSREKGKGVEGRNRKSKKRSSDDSKGRMKERM